MGLKNVFSTLSSTRQQENRLIDNVFGLLAYFVKSLIPPTPTYSFRRLFFWGFFLPWELKSYRLMKLSST